jgi:selenium-dependent molybdenum hydroxylase system YqeB family protein
MALIVIRGSGDVGSAVAHALYTAGDTVVLHDSSAPAHTRRGMAFVDAIFEKTTELKGVLAKRARTLADLRRMTECRRAIPVVDAPIEDVLATLHPYVLVDARMRKRERPESQRGLAPLTVGLGPNFEAGVNVDVAVETAWGDVLGTVVRSGRTREQSGEPQEIAGHARDRYVYAPAAGVFTTRLGIGDSVVKGQEVARIGDTPLHAPLAGCLRGLTHDGVTVREGAKVIEVDPRGRTEFVRGLGERPQRIAEGVLAAVKTADACRTSGVAKPFSVGALIGTLGGLIGLGGAEFRLPALVGWFRFGLREAIAINVFVSLVTVAAALAFRAGVQGVAPLFAYTDAVLVLIAGSLAGAWMGSGLVRRLSMQWLYRTVAALLVMLAAAMAAHAWVPHGGGALSDSAAMLLAVSVVAGVGIGAVGSMLGVAGGELLIPAFVLIHGADIKTAGTLALLVSLPMLLLTLWRLRRLPQARSAMTNTRFIAAMSVGSLAGAFLGSRLMGVAPEDVLSLLLAAILLVSALKIFAK